MLNENRSDCCRHSPESCSSSLHALVSSQVLQFHQIMINPFQLPKRLCLPTLFIIVWLSNSTFKALQMSKRKFWIFHLIKEKGEGSVHWIPSVGLASRLALSTDDTRQASEMPFLLESKCRRMRSASFPVCFSSFSSFFWAQIKFSQVRGPRRTDVKAASGDVEIKIWKKFPFSISQSISFRFALYNIKLIHV